MEMKVHTEFFSDCLRLVDPPGACTLHIELLKGNDIGFT
jgi:hypothetical protein